jgi:uncharacterized protein YecT (DUF1311 family)
MLGLAFVLIAPIAMHASSNRWTERAVSPTVGKPMPIPPPSYNKRCEASAATELAMDSCVKAEVRELESEVTHALAVEVGLFSATLVVADQHAWTGYEVAECRLKEHPYPPSNMQQLVYAQCERGLLVQRINQIRSDVGALRR